jgi:hypothetical protein
MGIARLRLVLLQIRRGFGKQKGLAMRDTIVFADALSKKSMTRLLSSGV